MPASTKHRRGTAGKQKPRQERKVPGKKASTATLHCPNILIKSEKPHASASEPRTSLDMIQSLYS